MNYGDCINVIDNLEEIEQIIITTPRYIFKTEEKLIYFII